MNYFKKSVLIGMIGTMFLATMGCTREVSLDKDSFIKQPETTEEASTSGVKPTVKPDYTKDGGVVEYTQLEDGTYEYNGTIYTHKNIMSGIMPGTNHRSTLVVLDNSEWYSFDIFAQHILDNNKINYATPNNNYKVVELHHHDNALLDGRYISEKEGDSLYIELSEGYVSFWDFENVLTEEDMEYHMSSVEPGLSYRVDCRYMIVGDSIELYTNPARPNITIVDDITLEYNGVKYVYEEYSSKEEYRVVNKTGYPQYDELIDFIINIKDTNEYPAEVYRENGICYIFGMYDTFERSGFYLVDLDGDGIEELLLGDNGDGTWRGTVYMIYTIKDGLLQKVCSGGERDTYTLCEGNYIMEELTGGAANGVTAYYTFEDSELKLKEAVVYDGYYDPNNPHFLCTENLDAASGVPITGDEAVAINDKYIGLPIEFMLFVRPEYK